MTKLLFSLIFAHFLGLSDDVKHADVDDDDDDVDIQTYILLHAHKLSNNTHNNRWQQEDRSNVLSLVMAPWARPAC